MSKAGCRTALLTRLHSSRMRTARLLTVSPMHCTGGGGWSWRGACLGGCLLWGACSGGVCSRGAWSWWVPGLGVPGPGGGWWYPSMHWGRPPLPVNRMTDRCKNITFATSLRTVTRMHTTQYRRKGSPWQRPPPKTDPPWTETQSGQRPPGQRTPPPCEQNPRQV